MDCNNGRSYYCYCYNSATTTDTHIAPTTTTKNTCVVLPPVLINAHELDADEGDFGTCVVLPPVLMSSHESVAGEGGALCMVAATIQLQLPEQYMATVDSEK